MACNCLAFIPKLQGRPATSSQRGSYIDRQDPVVVFVHHNDVQAQGAVTAVTTTIPAVSKTALTNKDWLIKAVGELPGSGIGPAATQDTGNGLIFTAAPPASLVIVSGAKGAIKQQIDEKALTDEKPASV